MNYTLRGAKFCNWGNTSEAMITMRLAGPEDGRVRALALVLASSRHILSLLGGKLHQ